MSVRTDRNLDCTNCARGVWLVKVPKYMKEKWATVQPNSEVGRLRVTRSQSSKQPVVTFTSAESVNGETSSKMPKEHKFILRPKETLLGVLSQSVPISGSEHPEPERLFMEGHVIQKFECQPVVDSNYLRLKRESMQKASVPLKQTVKIDGPVNTYKPKSIHKEMKELEMAKKLIGKKARDDREKVQEILYAAFEKHQYYNIKDLQKITRQPITYLKEILKEMCDYNVKNPHKHMYELKMEYRHYKSDAKTAEEEDSS